MLLSLSASAPLSLAILGGLLLPATAAPNLMPGSTSSPPVAAAAPQNKYPAVTTCTKILQDDGTNYSLTIRNQTSSGCGVPGQDLYAHLNEKCYSVDLPAPKQLIGGYFTHFLVTGDYYPGNCVEQSVLEAEHQNVTCTTVLSTDG